MATATQETGAKYRLKNVRFKIKNGPTRIYAFKVANPLDKSGNLTKKLKDEIRGIVASTKPFKCKEGDVLFPDEWPEPEAATATADKPKNKPAGSDPELKLILERLDSIEKENAETKAKNAELQKMLEAAAAPAEADEPKDSGSGE